MLGWRIVPSLACFAEREITDLVSEVNRFFAADVADFRRQVEAAGVGLLAE